MTMDYDTYPQYPQIDNELVDKIVYKLKAQGIFDQFRKDCLADVDTKPAFQNLQQRVNGTVASFLANHKWREDLNKNQLRESLRRHVQQGFLEVGVDRIVDQVVNPKICPVFLPKVEDVVYNCLGIEKPKNSNVSNNYQGLMIQTSGLSFMRSSSPLSLLPKDLDPVSPESDHNLEDSMVNDDSTNLNNGESRVYGSRGDLDDLSNDSHLSGISELTSHGSFKDFSESAHMPEKTDSHLNGSVIINHDSLSTKTPMMPNENSNGTCSDFDNFSNLKEKLKKNDPLTGNIRKVSAEENTPPQEIVDSQNQDNISESFNSENEISKMTVFLSEETPKKEKEIVTSEYSQESSSKNSFFQNSAMLVPEKIEPQKIYDPCKNNSQLSSSDVLPEITTKIEKYDDSSSTFGKCFSDDSHSSDMQSKEKQSKGSRHHVSRRDERKYDRNKRSTSNGQRNHSGEDVRSQDKSYHKKPKQDTDSEYTSSDKDQKSDNAVSDQKSDNAEETPKKLLDETPKKLVDETPKKLMDETPKQLVDETPKNLVDEPPKNLVDETPKNLVGEMPKNLVDEIPKNLVDETAKHFVDEVPKHFVDETPRNLVEETPKHLVEETPKHLVEETPKHLVEETPKHLFEETPKHLFEEIPKHLMEETPKHLVDETPKNFVDETPKNLVDETPNNFVDEIPKNLVDETPKQLVDETPKKFVDETPKKLVDETPKKLVDETTKNLEGEKPKKLVDETTKNLEGEKSKKLVEKIPNKDKLEEQINLNCEKPSASPKDTFSLEKISKSTEPISKSESSNKSEKKFSSHNHHRSSSKEKKHGDYKDHKVKDSKRDKEKEDRYKSGTDKKDDGRDRKPKDKYNQDISKRHTSSRDDKDKYKNRKERGTEEKDKGNHSDRNKNDPGSSKPKDLKHKDDQNKYNSEREKHKGDKEEQKEKKEKSLDGKDVKYKEDSGKRDKEKNRDDKKSSKDIKDKKIDGIIGSNKDTEIKRSDPESKLVDSDRKQSSDDRSKSKRSSSSNSESKFNSSNSKHRSSDDKGKDRERDRDSKKRKGERCKEEVKHKEARRSTDRDSNGGGSSSVVDKGNQNQKDSNKKGDADSVQSLSNSGNDKPSCSDSGESSKKGEGSNCEKSMETQDSDIDSILHKINSSIEEVQQKTSKSSPSKKRNEGGTKRNSDENYDTVSEVEPPLRKPKIAKNIFEIRKIMQARKNIDKKRRKDFLKKNNLQKTYTTEAAEELEPEKVPLAPPPPPDPKKEFINRVSDVNENVDSNNFVEKRDFEEKLAGSVAKNNSGNLDQVNKKSVCLLGSNTAVVKNLTEGDSASSQKEECPMEEDSFYGFSESDYNLSLEKISRLKSCTHCLEDKIVAPLRFDQGYTKFSEITLPLLENRKLRYSPQVTLDKCAIPESCGIKIDTYLDNNLNNLTPKTYEKQQSFHYVNHTDSPSDKTVVTEPIKSKQRKDKPLRRKCSENRIKKGGNPSRENGKDLVNHRYNDNKLMSKNGCFVMVHMMSNSEIRDATRKGSSESVENLDSSNNLNENSVSSDTLDGSALSNSLDKSDISLDVNTKNISKERLENNNNLNELLRESIYSNDEAETNGLSTSKDIITNCEVSDQADYPDAIEDNDLSESFSSDVGDSKPISLALTETMLNNLLKESSIVSEYTDYGQASSPEDYWVKIKCNLDDNEESADINPAANASSLPPSKTHSDVETPTTRVSRITERTSDKHECPDLCKLHPAVKRSAEGSDSDEVSSAGQSPRRNATGDSIDQKKER